MSPYIVPSSLTVSNVMEIPRTPVNRYSTPTMKHVEGIGMISNNLCKRINRFFEGVIFLQSLIEACRTNNQIKAPAENYDADESPYKIFKCFVNKMAQVCDNVPFGKTVTSLAIIKHVGGELRYTFASNQRTVEDSECAKKVIQKLLSDVGLAQPSEIQDDGESPLFHRILQDILEFHAERIKAYGKRLMIRLGTCIEDCDRTNSPEPVDQSELLVRAANSLRKSTARELIIEKARVGKMDQSEHWSEFQHDIGRLASYLAVVRTIIIARKRIPQLFENFDITFLESSISIPNPMNSIEPRMSLSRKRQLRSAHSIIGRMIGDPAERAKHQKYAESIQHCDLDKLIMDRAGSETFRPIVHCEVLLLDSLCKEFDNEIRPIPFFDDIRYIGCSKPTCRLCEYYFGAHKSGIQVRPGHKNLYPNWIVPDVAMENSPKAYEKNGMIDKVLEKVRQSALLALREKVSDGSRFDSNTYSCLPTQPSLADGADIGNNLASILEDLSITPTQTPTSSPKGPEADDDAWSVVADGDSDGEREDDGGGLLLFTGRNIQA
ncbi:uncharacterized protein CTRU02_209461 [Colletotrichum truncatum]|uniref:Uncharacterized protein n=1 Tax=Colletotrichum truncatum TaxID=5467 RepID=A0ACC3YSG4_COLTU